MPRASYSKLIRNRLANLSAEYGWQTDYTEGSRTYGRAWVVTITMQASEHKMIATSSAQASDLLSAFMCGYYAHKQESGK